MDGFYPTNLLELLVVGTVLGIIVMAVIQKFKLLSCIDNNCRIWILNVVLSLGLCIPFSKCFYQYDLLSSIWVGIFSFAEAPAIYDLLKKQNFINLKSNDSEEENND